MKKILFKIVALIFCGTLAVSAASPAVQEESETDVSLQRSVLEAFGIVDESLAEQPTRGEFAQILSKLAGGYRDERDDVTYYKDVGYDNQYLYVINTVTQLGLMKGKEDGNFYPEEAVEYNDVIVGLVRACGYEELASRSGGYPVGYLVVGGSEKIIKDVKTLTQSNLIKLLYNTLHADYLQQSAFGEDITYQSDQTLIEAVFGAKRSYGVVIANDVTDLYGNEICAKNYVKVRENGKTESELMLDMAGAAAGQLGKELEIYSDIEAGSQVSDPGIICAFPTERNSQLNIAPDDIQQINDDLRRIEYSSEEKSMRAVIDQDAGFVYNGQGIYEVTAQDLRITTGALTLLDNDGDGSYEVVNIQDCVNLIAQEFSMTSSKLMLKFPFEGGNVIELDDTAGDYTLYVYKNGKISSPSAILPGNVVSYGKSKDGSVVVVYISDETVSGSVTALGDETIFIENEEYSISKGFVENSYYGATVDATGNFVLDPWGDVAYFETDTASSGMQYGYLLKKARGSRLQEEDYLILTADNKKAQYTAASNLKVYLDAEPTEMELTPQMIGYKLNSAGELASVYLAQEQHPQPSSVPQPGLELTRDYSEDTARYREYTFTLDLAYTVNGDTKVFQIWMMENGVDVDIEKSNVIAGTDLGDEQSLACKLYNGTYDKYVPYVCVCYPAGYAESSSSDQNAYNQHLFVVEKKTQVSRDGELITKLTGAFSGAIKDFYLDEEMPCYELLKNATAGQAYKIYANSQDVITSATLVFTPQKAPAQRKTGDSLYADSFGTYTAALESSPSYSYSTRSAKPCFSYGKVYHKTSRPTICHMEFTDDNRFPYVFESASKIYVFDCATGKLSISSFDAISADEKENKMLISTRSGVPKTAVIYKNLETE